MILEISSALMSMSILHMPSPAGPGLPLLRQSLANLRELRRDASVVHGAANARDDAADDRGIHAPGHVDAASGDLRETLLQLRGVLGRQRRCRGDLGSHDLLMLHETFA